MRYGRWAALLAGALMLIGSAQHASAVDWSKAQTINVTTTEYAFEPKSFSFKQGTVYRLHLVNPGKELHEFASPEFFKAIRVRNPQVLNADRTEIEVQPGKSADLFFVAQTPGAYKLRCPDHDWAGMTGDITIAP
jgi:uncharacterized cupredoxin-like copper-binding protein